MADRGVAVALLFGDEELGAQLRGALVDLGARIVHEGAVMTFGADQIKATGADIVVVNLDDDADEHLDRLYDAIDGDHPRLIFNDAAASRGLEGWDRARWARHLAAKLLAGTDIDPPRPVDARGIDMPVVQTPPAPADTGHAHVPPLAETEARSEELEAELEALLSQGDEAAPFAAMDLDEVVPAGTAATAAFEPAFDEPGVVDDAVSDYRDPDDDAPAAPQVISEGFAAELNRELPASDDYIFGDAGPLASPAPQRHQALALNDEFSDLAELFIATEDEPDYLFGASENHGEAPFDAPAVSLPPDEAEAFAMPELAPEPLVPPPGPLVEVSHEDFAGFGLMDEEDYFDEPSPAAVPTGPVVSTGMFSLASMDDEPTSPPPDASASDDIVVPEIQSRATQIAQPIPPEWSLLDDDIAVDAPTPPAETGPNPFGIEKVSAAEFLAPERDESSDDHPLEPGLGLELVSMEEAVAPRASDGEYFAETFLDSAAASVRRVLALVVANDSRDAAGLFLASVPSRLPALVVVLQQGDAADVVRGLAATTTLPARVAEAGRFAAQSTVLVLPPSQALTLRRDGQVSLADDPASGVDASLSQLAGTFGADLIAIVFVGDGRDGVAGAQAVRDRGGRVWVEDPGDRVSATIAGIHAERIESFTGSVAVMAARLIEEFP